LTERVVVDAHAVADVVHQHVQLNEDLVLDKWVIYMEMTDGVD